MAPAGQDRFTLKAPNGVAFSEFRGYDTWQDVAVSETEEGIKTILGNPAMINAYEGRHSRQWQAFSRWRPNCKDRLGEEKEPCVPYFVEVPDTLKSVSFIEKDSKRFPDTRGWGYAQFLYDTASDTLKPYGNDSSCGKKVCYQCHTLVTARDYIFTNYPQGERI
jgi:hypothetical protein